MVSEGGVKNAVDPLLGSQAPFMAPVLRTVKIDGDHDGYGIFLK